MYKSEKILLITRRNNEVSEISNLGNVTFKGVDLPLSLIFIKKLIGVRLYYFIWQFLVFIQLIKRFNFYKKSFVHQITFTPMYYPPIYFLLPFKFIWGPLGGGETYPLNYLKSLKKRDILKEGIRTLIRYSIYINPIFYFACVNSDKIICSTFESAKMIPKKFKSKIHVELMVFDKNKNLSKEKEKTIIIANRLIDWKMTHLFVESFFEFNKEKKTEYKLIIVGNGPYFDKIKPFIDNEKILHYNRFENRNDMLNLLKKSSLFVSMSLRDSGAASLLEAISYGIPFLVSNSGAHRIFLNKEIGFGFDLENFEKDKLKIKKTLNKILKENILEMESNKVIKQFHSYFSEEQKISRIKSILS
jgi:hypothetical protein